MSSEKKEGYDAYYSNKGKGDNPHILTNQTRWMVEAWDEGWAEAEDDDVDDDDY